MARLAYIFGDRYEAELALLGRFVREGDRVVDIGAHYGTYTLALSELVGADGHVIAVEPASRARAVLARNLALNGYTDRVTVQPCAIGADSGEVALQLHADPSRNRIGVTDPTVRSELVPIRPLDDLVGDTVSFIKLDVEGAEVLAYRGARVVLEKYRPTVLFEYQPAAATSSDLDARELWDGLLDLGYVMHRVVGGELVEVGQPPVDSVTNFFAVQP